MVDFFSEVSFEEKYSALESEVKTAQRAIGRNKSPGLNGVSAELFQAIETESIKIITRLGQQIWKRKQRPTDWKLGLQLNIK